MRVPALALIAIAVVVVATPAVAHAQDQTPVSPAGQGQSGVSVTVTGRESAVIADAIHKLKGCGDPFLATTAADNLIKLATTMEASDRTYRIGPLSAPEQGVIDLGESLKKHHVDQGSIRLQMRQWNSTPGDATYTLSHLSFIEFVADLATGAEVKVRGAQQIRLIAVARMIGDLNAQAQVMSAREVLAGTLHGSDLQPPHGVSGSRVMQIGDAIVANATAYDFVPAGEERTFTHWAAMGDGGVFTEVPRAIVGSVNLRSDGAIYATSVEHFTWFFGRFLVKRFPAHDEVADEGTTDLGGKMLDYLTWQLQRDVLAAVIKAIDASDRESPQAITAGPFLNRGPGLEIVAGAPGLVTAPSSIGADYCTLVVSANDAGRLPELRKWLGTKATELESKIAKAAGR